MKRGLFIYVYTLPTFFACDANTNRWVEALNKIQHQPPLPLHLPKCAGKLLVGIIFYRLSWGSMYPAHKKIVLGQLFVFLNFYFENISGIYFTRGAQIRRRFCFGSTWNHVGSTKQVDVPILAPHHVRRPRGQIAPAAQQGKKGEIASP